MQAMAAKQPDALAAIPARQRRVSLLLGGLLALSVVMVFLAFGIGAVPIGPLQVCAIVAKQFGLSLPVGFDEQQELVLLAVRLPRVLLGVFVGAGLAVAGAAMQGLFRNPLADPGLLGVSSGAAFAAAFVIVIGKAAAWQMRSFPGVFTLPLAAFLGGLIATLMIYRVARSRAQTSVTAMLLTGIAVNAICGAGTGLLSFLANDTQLRELTFWNLGSLGGATWPTVIATLPFILIAMFLLVRLARALNAFLLGEAEALHLGIPVERIKRQIVLLVALTVGAGVAMTGTISFVGLVVPHLLRLMIGPDHRALLPGSLLLGASLMTGADVLARTIVIPAELPIGIITAFIGAPFFLWLLLRQQRLRGVL